MRIALAYGSRGTAFSASHYDGVRKVISLTKLRGAGNLAHEYGRALDDFLGELCGKTTCLSACLRNCTERVNKSYVGTVEDIETAMRKVMHACMKIGRTGRDMLLTDSLAIDEHIDRFDEACKPYLDKIKSNVSSLSDADVRFLEKFNEFVKNYMTKEAVQMYLDLYMQDVYRTDLKNYNLLNFEILNKDGMTELGLGTYNSLRYCIKNYLYTIYIAIERYKRSYRQYRYNLDNVVTEEVSEFYRYNMKYYVRYDAVQIELFSKAFERYVYEKLKSKGIRSDYLVCFVDNSFYAKGTHAYPDDKEYAQIAVAMDELFDVIRKLYPAVEMKDKEIEDYKKRYDEDTYNDNKELMANIVQQSVLAGMNGELQSVQKNLGIGNIREDGKEANCRLYIRNKVTETYKKLCKIASELPDVKKCQVLVNAYMAIGIPNIGLGSITNKRGNSQAYDVVDGHLKIDYYAEHAKKAEAVIEACSLLIVNSNARNMTKSDRWILWNIMVVIMCKVMGVDVRTYLVDDAANNMYAKNFSEFKKISTIAFDISKNVLEQVYKQILGDKLG